MSAFYRYSERRYINTFLKMLFYTHTLRRFDKSAEARRCDNLLILWADEAQRFLMQPWPLSRTCLKSRAEFT
jgi:hypothetical protein